MFPLRDHNPSGRIPFVTFGLIAVNILVFLLTFPGWKEWELAQLYSWYGVSADKVLSGTGFESLITHMFLHGGWLHIAGNMLFLWIYGDNLEEEFGHLGFLIFYLVAGLAAAGLQILADPESGVPMIGASGAVAGVMGGYVLLWPKAKIDVLFFFVIFFRIVAIPAWGVLGFWFVTQTIYGLSTPVHAAEVAYFAHIGGFIAGLLMVWPLWQRKGGRAFWNRTHGQPEHPAATYPLAKSRIPPVRR